jgi:P27 family predicted phage terminase small subunit
MSIAVRQVRGNPGRRRISDREPRPPAGIPAAPAHLDAVARAEWARVAPDLAAARLLTGLDRAGLAAYCTAWSRWLAAEAKLQELGTIVPSARGRSQLSPYFRVANVALKQLREFGADFGLSPASRSRIQVMVPAPMSALERFRRKHDGPPHTNEED